MCKSRQHFMFLSIEFQRLLHGVATPANSGAYSQSAMITSDKTLMKVFSDIISFSMSAGLQQLYLHLLPKLIAYCQCLYMENWKGIVGKRRRSKDILGPCVRYWSKKEQCLVEMPSPTPRTLFSMQTLCSIFCLDIYRKQVHSFQRLFVFLSKY